MLELLTRRAEVVFGLPVAFRLRKGDKGDIALFMRVCGAFNKGDIVLLSPLLIGRFLVL